MSSATKFGTSSRFAALHIEESSDENDVITKKDKVKKSNAEKNAKKKARKKKKAAVENEATNQLRNLAFSKPVSAKAIQNIHQQRHGIDPSISQNTQSELKEEIKNQGKSTEINHQGNSTDIPNWEEWKSKDEEFVLEQFQRDLNLALRLSTVEKVGSNAVTNNKKQKKTKKLPTMSIDEFASLHIPEPSHSLEPQLKLDPDTLRNGYCPDELDSKYYELDVPPDHIEQVTSQQNEQQSKNKKNKKRKKKVPNSDIKSLSEVLTEVHQDEKSGINEVSAIDPSSLIALRNTIDEKDDEIAHLREELKMAKRELLEVKKRNQKLCAILTDGEMKEKSEILHQVEDLTNVKNELSAELTEMHSSLEQERSKVSALKIELAKYQQVRTKTKSISDKK